MYIKILAGAYGHRPNPGQSYIEKKDCTSGPFEVDDKEAARLIGLGIAKEASGGPEPAEVAEMKEEAQEDLEQLPIQQLRKMAKDLGLSADGSKAALADKIRNAASKRADDGDAEPDPDDVPEEKASDEAFPQEALPVLQASEPEV